MQQCALSKPISRDQLVRLIAYHFLTIGRVQQNDKFQVIVSLAGLLVYFQFLCQEIVVTWSKFTRWIKVRITI